MLQYNIIFAGIQKLLQEIYTGMPWEQGDLISLLLFFKI
jgi:hypothetical protein